MPRPWLSFRLRERRDGVQGLRRALVIQGPRRLARDRVCWPLWLIDERSAAADVLTLNQVRDAAAQHLLSGTPAFERRGDSVGGAECSNSAKTPSICSASAAAVESV